MVAEVKARYLKLVLTPKPKSEQAKEGGSTDQ
jgi:hypothetical protein